MGIQETDKNSKNNNSGITFVSLYSKHCYITTPDISKERGLISYVPNRCMGLNLAKDMAPGSDSQFLQRKQLNVDSAEMLLRLTLEESLSVMRILKLLQNNYVLVSVLAASKSL